MESIYILIPIAILLLAIAVALFLWAVKNDQFHDIEREGLNILLEQYAPHKNKEQTHNDD